MDMKSDSCYHGVMENTPMTISAPFTEPGMLTNSAVSTPVLTRFTEILAQWQAAVNAKHYGAEGYTHPADQVHGHFGKLYARLDIGGSGAFMVDLATGVVYGIKGYGKVDKKKISGNIYDPNFNGAVLVSTRFRYGRFDLRKPEDKQDVLAVSPAVRS